MVTATNALAMSPDNIKLSKKQVSFLSSLLKPCLLEKIKSDITISTLLRRERGLHSTKQDVKCELMHESVVDSVLKVSWKPRNVSGLY